METLLKALPALGLELNLADKAAAHDTQAGQEATPCSRKKPCSRTKVSRLGIKVAESPGL